jgi:antitoxin component YwqK of YwqJK toxin-antitoxin module
VQEGRWTFWHANGQKSSEGAYENGKLEGRWTNWHENGSIDHRYSGIYKAGRKIAPLPKK